MKTLYVSVASQEQIDAEMLKAVADARAGKRVTARHRLRFLTYEQMHRVLSPVRMQIVKTLAGQSSLSIREVARRVDRDVKSVHGDVTALINAGVIDRSEEGVSFPYDRIHLEVDIEAAA